MEDRLVVPKEAELTLWFSQTYKVDQCRHKGRSVDQEYQTS